MLTFEDKLDCFEEAVTKAKRRNKKSFRYTDAELFALANTLLRCADGWDATVGAAELVSGLRKRIQERRTARKKRNAPKRREKSLAQRQKSFAFD